MFFLLRRVLFGFFKGGEAPVGCRRVHSHRFSYEFPRRSPIQPIDSAIEPYFPGPADSFRFVLSAPAGTEVVRIYATLEKIAVSEADLKEDGRVDLAGVLHAEAMCTFESLTE